MSAAEWTRPTLVAARGQHAPARTGPRRAPFVLLVVGLLAGGLVALVALNTAAAAAELRRQSLVQSNDDTSGKLQQLRASLAARQAPAALGSAAAELGMVPADNPAFLRIAPNGRAKVLGSPHPASAPPVQQPAAPRPSHASTDTDARRGAVQPAEPATSSKATTPATGAHR